MINHGTTGGYYAHRRLKQEPCPECKTAIAEYSKNYRNATGRRDRIADRVRRQALAILRERHRAEYEALVAEVRASEAGQAT